MFLLKVDSINKNGIILKYVDSIKNKPFKMKLVISIKIIRLEDNR
ncbi:hypothetical protein ACZ87_01556 [Candidatus Erwinia dacicola]|uniref:Uncharacterized protein n=1 Tax=Candidatus Erwinia dacicola TaxID=252393 RepID=A0A328TUW4_9GAMM|nr:hypothetical protein ACZ87_01556 [Candidatus Erwinia dacicola]